MLLDEMAKELVTSTSEIVGGRTINIMNTEGVIIASTEEQRIGTFHQGALDAVRTGKPVAIEPEEVHLYPGAKQGYNMPIRIDGEIIGVIGIFGTPSEIKPLAQLLEVFAVKYYQLEAMSVPRLAEMELRTRLLRNILYPTDMTFRNVRMLMKELNFELTFPAAVAVVSSAAEDPEPSWGAAFSAALLEGKIVFSEKDLWGVLNDSVVILSSGNDLAARLERSGILSKGAGYRACIGDICRDFRWIPRSFEQAVTLQSFSASAMTDISEPQNRCHYLIRHTADREAECLDVFLSRMEETCSAEEIRVMMKSAAVYYEESHSVAKASEKLFIHKNTLQYRMKKLESILDIAGWPEFRKEFLVRLLLERYAGKQGLQTLL